MTIKRLALILPLGLLAASGVQAKPLPRYGVFVFSSLCWEKESGDAAGTRLTLTRARNGDRLALEYGNGGLNGSDIQSFELHGHRLRGKASTSDGELVFSAKLDDRSALLSARFDFQGADPIGPDRLRRVTETAKVPNCR